MRLVKSSLIVALLTCGLLLGAAIGMRYHSRLVARQWQQQLQTASASELDALLQRAAASGQAGLPLLVQAVGSPQPTVSWAARQVLFEQLDGWKSLPPKASVPMVEQLAALLAEQVGDFPPSARPAARSVAARILQWPMPGNPADHRPLWEHCRQIVQAGEEAGPSPDERQLADQSLAQPPTILLAKPPTLPNDSMGRLPGGALPVEVFSSGAPKVDKMEEPGLLRQAALSPPAGFRSTPERSLHLNQPMEVSTPGAQRLTEAEPSQRPVSLSSLPGRHGPLTMAEIRAMRQQSSEVVRPEQQQLDSDTLELIRRCSAGDDRAHEDLARRGFDKLHFQLARRLTDPNPDVRQELARSLPGMPGIDAACWLLWLARDENPEVRSTAIALLVTAGTPELLEQVERLASQDPDRRIQQQGEQIAQRRRAGSAESVTR